MTQAIHRPGDRMYLIEDTDRGGYLTWNHDNKVYVMAFTTGDKAEEYQHHVMGERPGEIKVIYREKAKEFAKFMVSRGVNWMLIDFPIENDKWKWWQIEVEKARHYSIVDLKGFVAREL